MHDGVDVGVLDLDHHRLAAVSQHCSVHLATDRVIISRWAKNFLICHDRHARENDVICEHMLRTCAMDAVARGVSSMDWKISPTGAFNSRSISRLTCGNGRDFMASCAGE